MRCFWLSSVFKAVNSMTTENYRKSFGPFLGCKITPSIFKELVYLITMKGKMTLWYPCSHSLYLNLHLHYPDRAFQYQHHNEATRENKHFVQHKSLLKLSCFFFKQLLVQSNTSPLCIAVKV